MVVVPVSSLVPMEVWNVWYAIDDGGDDPEEKPPEETPKMHLLLQCVPKQAASDESSQTREMRGQDFLLRALQQLNAALEAKVFEQQGGIASIGSTPAAGYPATHTPGSAPGGQTSPPPQAELPGTTAVTGLQAPVPQSQQRQAPQPQRRQGVQQRRPGSSGGPPVSGPGQMQESAPQEETIGPTPEQVAAQEEAVKLRLEPYERTIAALEERQRLFEDQETRIRALTKALEEHQSRANALLSQLQESEQRAKAEADQERENARQVSSTKAAQQQRISELEQEVSLRRAHEESLQQRVALMESELVVVHQKCAAASATDEEAKAVITEVQGLKLQRQQLQEQLQEQGRELSLAQEENWQLKEDRGREVDKARAMVERETLMKEQMQLELLQTQDLLRDKEAEGQLANEKVENLKRNLTTLNEEVTSLQALLDRERKHRAELDTKLGELELGKLHSTLDEHKVLVRGLRTELEKARQELNEERGRCNNMETEMAAAKKDLVRGQRQVDEFRHQITSQDELREEIRTLSERNESLRDQMKLVQQESRKVTERFEREIAEYLKAQKLATKEKETKLDAMGELREQMASAVRRAEEVQHLQEQTARALESAKEGAQNSEDVARQLFQVQEELAASLADRNELHDHVERITGKFREDVFTQDQRHAELEGLLEDRNNEIKLLMYRLQELSSRYVPVKGDAIDMILSKWINGYRPAVPFFRLAQGLYLFGRRQVTCKISNDKPVFRVGGGFLGFEKFLEQFASEELERLLTYELDERSGEPKFAEGLKAKQTMEESGLIEELRQKAAEEAHMRRGGSTSGLHPSLSRRSLNSSRSTM
eukprot:TRINITY_DN7554_c0_g1_i1.p1 TRINITY_DN7554_c0_g1~~TRINITY_DN7554_c0_g1_i1.p1  ORF type:complete len:954 (+),score=283.51 TRINITY_DN7554_c0_g1_i1:370-2862(+)